ncbi:MBL fold metallo-hydrolase [Oceanobacillus kimchii]|uniref:MBL fold metallo-hydrolase n=1 Tax=Oceanobacillus kimchii TaxID=746691 RepID=UPI003B01C91E
MEIIARPVGMVQANCYILKEGSNGIVVDPGGDAEIILSIIKEHNLDINAILLTHAHFDHIGALEQIRQKTNAPVYLHQAEHEWLSDPNLNGSYKLIGQSIVAAPAEFSVVEGGLTIGEFSMQVYHTPGHSPGSVSYIFPEQQLVISGDVLFQKGIGRTDLPEGDIDVLEHSIREKLYQLPEKYQVLSGHGPITTIQAEKDGNPFFQA